MLVCSCVCTCVVCGMCVCVLVVLLYKRHVCTPLALLGCITNPIKVSRMFFSNKQSPLDSTILSRRGIQDPAALVSCGGPSQHQGRLPSCDNTSLTLSLFSHFFSNTFSLLSDSLWNGTQKICQHPASVIGELTTFCLIILVSLNSSLY